MANPAPSATPTRKSVTGYVTKLVGDGATYGFINDEIFFQQTNVTDGPARSGDRVFAECEYSELLPIKWNATSIKIIGRASAGPVNNILDSDPRRQSRQGLLNQQQPSQAPLTQSLSTANTYQQHRQQRQPQQHDVIINQPAVPTPMQPQQAPPPPVSAAAMGLLDQANINQQPEFFSPFAQPPPQLQDLQPFQIDTPMGPPKLEYTSQLGAAFVQNQFMGGSLITQQPPQQPMLPQHQPQAQQQQQQQHQRQQQNHRDPRNTRDNNNSKGRFNDKNDRNQSNRGRNRTDKKYEQPRSSERENSANARSSRSVDSKDRSSGHGDPKTTKRDESSSTTSRQSPVSNTRSTNSASSDRGNTKHTPRRYYDAQNIPKTSILTNLNGCNMRTRCSSSVHVPSDLKNVIVNAHLRLDIKNTPKPILFEIGQQDAAEPEKPAPDDTKVGGNEVSTIDASAAPVTDNTTCEDATSQSSSDNKTSEQITPPSSKSDARLNHKYGVKVILISLPELESIYKKIFGPEMDSYSNESRNQPKLDEAITLLCNKGTNGGHSLIGGKFDAVLDGFVEGEMNEFERYGRQPDLIATCRRVVQEQTGLDLGPCQGWTLVSTFLYNNKSDYFTEKSSVEYSFIYLPHIWTMMIDDLSGKPSEQESQQKDAAVAADQGANMKEESTEATMVELDLERDATLEPQLVGNPKSETDAQGRSNPSLETNDVSSQNSKTEADVLAGPEVDDNIGSKALTDEADKKPVAGEAVEAIAAPEITLQNISDLKVVDLKLELDRRDIKYKPNAKKAELASALQMSLQPSATCDSNQTTAINPENKDEQVAEQGHDGTGEVQLEEGEVATDDDNTNDADADDSPKEVPEDVNEATKRKSDEMEDTKEQETKKVCKDDRKKIEKVTLITKPFIVKARQAQSQLATLSLNEAVQASRYDQFELSVASAIMKESLTQHLSEYIFTTLIEDGRQKSRETSEASNSFSISNSLDTTNNDTNNNSTATKPATATAVAVAGNQAPNDKVNLVKEYPVDRYINLAFAYFDSAHTGYIQADDLFKLFNNTGLTISKRALWSLIGEGEKFNYRTLADLSTKLPPNYVYRFPVHFNHLPGSSTSQPSSESTNKMIEHQGVKYDVERLIQQVRDAEISRVNMVQRFNDAISRHDQQEAEIHVLEVSQMSLSKSIKELNAEISDLKREKSSADKRIESLKKQIKEAIKTLSES